MLGNEKAKERFWFMPKGSNTLYVSSNHLHKKPKNRIICYLLGSMQIKYTQRKLEGIYRRGF